MIIIKSVWHTCLVLPSEGDSDSKPKAVRVQLLCTHGTQGPPENKFDLASVVIRKLSDKRMKLPRSNINAVFGRVVYGLLGCSVLGIPRYMYLGQDNK